MEHPRQRFGRILDVPAVTLRHKRVSSVSASTLEQPRSTAPVYSECDSCRRRGVSVDDRIFDAPEPFHTLGEVEQIACYDPQQGIDDRGLSGSVVATDDDH